MQDIIPFDFNGHEVRTITKDDDHWFVLRDVLAAMGSTTRPALAKRSVDEGLGRGYSVTTPLETAGGRQRLTLINEPAITYLVATSRTEMGRRLNRFIHVEVLPSLRRTGQYIHEGSGIDRQLQERSVSYPELMAAFGKAKKKRFTATEERVAGSFSTAMKRAGLPGQFETRDGELYLTPALADVMVNYLNTKDFGHKDRALALIEQQKESTQ